MGAAKVSCSCNSFCMTKPEVLKEKEMMSKTGNSTIPMLPLPMPVVSSSLSLYIYIYIYIYIYRSPAARRRSLAPVASRLRPAAEGSGARPAGIITAITILLHSNIYTYIYY